MKSIFRFSIKMLSVVILMAITITGCQKDDIEAVEEELIEIEQQENSSVCRHSAKADRFTRFASLARAGNVRYYIAPSVSADWASATRRAARAWSGTTNAITMTRVFNRATADLVIREAPDPGWDTSAAIAQFPEADGRVGNDIHLNETYVNPGNAALTRASRYYIMLHEIGHTFGFQHHDAVSFMPARFTDPVVAAWGGITGADRRTIRTQFPN
ncbi:matrixin family metalloprotease [Aquimarina megaterium]|uniref:matrixin family metalloprotease n=1 Tax=Aquimarina megaterium TaxID=1443666 RepID=UPI00046F6F49|nr:matrixin family metalloprotease [Aquimarina megaterium]